MCSWLCALKGQVVALTDRDVGDQSEQAEKHGMQRGPHHVVVATAGRHERADSASVIATFVYLQWGQIFQRCCLWSSSDAL